VLPSRRVRRSSNRLDKLDVATMPPEGVEVDVGNGVKLIQSKVWPVQKKPFNRRTHALAAEYGGAQMPRRD
jgi:hypothetical protein